MSKVDKIENKEQNEKSNKILLKKFLFKRKKLKKYFKWNCVCQSTFNNTIISITDTNGNIVLGLQLGKRF